MKKKTVLFAMALVLCTSAVYAQDCSILVGGFTVAYADGTTGTWTISDSFERDSNFFPCYAAGAVTVGGQSTDFYLYYFKYLSNSTGSSVWLYTEDLGEMTQEQPGTLLVLDCEAGIFTPLEGEYAQNNYNISKVTRTGAALVCSQEEEPDTCPLASVLAGDAQSLAMLRQIRDGKLAKSPAGQALIALYYKAAPAVEKIIASNPSAKALLGKTVKAVLPALAALN